jgi:uncharacterized protein YhfF
MVTLAAALAKYAGAFPYPVGDSEALNAQILDLMRSGVKTGTCDAWAIYEDGTEDLPIVGRVDIALNWQAEPAIATRTLVVERIAFDQMDEARVAQQGEFRDLAHWRLGYEAYLTRAGRFAPDVDLMFERFEIVEDFGQ